VIEECLVVEFSVEGDDCPLADATRATGATVNARPPQLRADGYALLQFTTTTPDALAEVLDADDRIRYLHAARTDDGARFRCLSKHPCVVHELVSAGFVVDESRYVDGRATFSGAVVGRDVLRGVLDTAGETVGVALERAYPLGDETDDATARRWGLTRKQSDALRTARDMGYFSVPREADAGEVADALGVSKSAFLERLRRGQQRLLDAAL